MSVSTNDLKNGMTLDLDGTLFQIVEFQHVKPGKGGAFVRTKLRNMRTGAVVEKTFNAGVKVGLAIVERREMQYLYPDGDDLVFMDLRPTTRSTSPARSSETPATTWSRVHRTGRDPRRRADLGRAARLDRPGVKQTEPGIKGDTRNKAIKPATLETGLVVQVPMFIEEGERIKVDTRCGAYVEREK